MISLEPIVFLLKKSLKSSLSITLRNFREEMY